MTTRGDEMRLLVIRHGIAEDRDAFAATGKPDELRPLTNEGRKKMRRAAAGLTEIVGRIDVLAASPLTRAAQTAEIVAMEYGEPPIETVDALAPDRRPDELLPWLRARDPGTVAAVVGHEPHLGFLVGWLLTGRNDSFVEMKKGGAALLQFDDAPTGGNALLRWSVPPKLLRMLDAR